MGRKNKPVSRQPVLVEIEKLSHEGRGVARVNGKTVFIHGALPGEQVLFEYRQHHRRFDEGVVVEVRRASPNRVAPKCPHYDLCGGCSLQHLAVDEQIRLKQELLLENLRHLAKLEPQSILPPLSGPVWGYRHKARLGVRYVKKKQRVLVGFRERQSRYLADLRRCEVLHPKVGERIGELADLIDKLECRENIPQIEVAVDDVVAALVFRNLVTLSESDRVRLADWGASHDMPVYLQPKGPETVFPLWPDNPRLVYELADHGITIRFQPTDFTQVNPAINRAMIPLTIDLLALDSNDNLIEFFSGLGNFTLPFARRVASVTAIEGEEALVERARLNASTNKITNVRYFAADLATDVTAMPWLGDTPYNKVFLDPPRSGAFVLLPAIARLEPERIVYVSCNPASLARDAGMLVHELGFQLLQTGVMDMFPHTAHVESVAVFSKK
jgi:23S rRNA (uracil1939-C5)-methyltransferase